VKSVEILITNFNSGDAVALCIESIRKYTAYPHTITVRDDGSWTEPRPECGLTEPYNDIAYLRACRDKGWIKLIEGKENVGHGTSLTALLDQCSADLAMVLDCDIQIESGGWLEAMVAEQERTGAALVANIEHFNDDNDCLQSWFFMVDMAQYPAIKDDWGYTYRKDGKGMRGTGYLIQEHIAEQGRLITPLPAELGGRPSDCGSSGAWGMPGRWHHACHISVLSAPQTGENWRVRQDRYAKIQAELRKLRASNP